MTMENTTILAPGSLHLPLYEKICLKKGDNLGLNILTPQAYIASKLSKPRSPILPVLYTYSKLLENLNPENVFYPSRKDYTFLQACYEFMEWVFLYQIEDFPEATQRQKNLKEVIELLLQVELWQKEASGLSFEEAGSVQILKAGYPEMMRFFIDRLIENGASVIGAKKRKHTFYWSASNPRKEMELAALTILERDLPLEKVFIALAAPEQSRVLEQVFNARRIPYTLLHQNKPSQVLVKFQAALDYILHKDQAHLKLMLEAFNPESSLLLRRYMDLFPDGSNLAELSWIENPLVSAKQFEKLKSLETQIQAWKPELERYALWDHTSIEEIASLIQEQIPLPKQEDMDMMDGIIHAYASIMDQLHCAEDLQLFKDHLGSLHPDAALEKMEGVLVGTPQEISPLHEYIFYIGADGLHYPPKTAHEGIFDEDYLRHLAYPPLSDRLLESRSQLENQMDCAQDLYVLIPQSDYEGKNIPASHEMNLWMKRYPNFKSVYDSNIYTVPDFSLSAGASRTILAPDASLNARASSLKTFEDCPFKHYMRYGLNLSAPNAFFDTLRVSPDILADILNKTFFTLNKPFATLEKSECDALVAEEFRFAFQVFPKNPHIQILVHQYSEKVWEMIQILSSLIQNWHLDLQPGNYELALKEVIEDTAVSIDGPLAPSHKAVFNLIDPNTGEPKTTLALDLKPGPVEKKAFKISYGSKSTPVSANPVGIDSSESEFIKSFLKSSVCAQDLEAPQDEAGRYVQEKLVSYDQKKQDLINTASSLIHQLSGECILPEHKKGTCQYCAYRSICRNGAIERG